MNLKEIAPGNLSIKPIFGVVANANCVNQVVIRIQFCVSFPQPILPKPAHYKLNQNYAID